jgi:transcriptional regulator with XRE-family HTH domain
VPEHSPTLRRRELAGRLRDLRKRAGLTVDEVAAQLLCSPPKISRIETATRPASLRDVRDLCDLYRVGDAERSHLMDLAREAKQQGWWQRFDDLAIESLIGLEIEAKKITSYESSVVPWTFQTEAYAKAVIKGSGLHIEDRIVDERVTVRMTRQELLRSPAAPNMWFLIDEAALRRVVGDNRVMRDQMAKILEVSASSHVDVQVVPFKAGAHPGVDNTFTLLELDKSFLPPVVFVENLAGMFYLERDTDIQRYREVIDYLKACALSPVESIKFIEEVKKTFGSV